MKFFLLAVSILLSSLPLSAKDWERLSGDESSVSSPFAVAVDDADAWKDLWGRHQAANPAPQVDFNHERVIAVFAGERPTAGYSVQAMVEPIDPPGAVSVRYRVKGPAPDAMAADVMTRPYLMIKVARTPGPVNFDELRDAPNSPAVPKALAQAEARVGRLLAPFRNSSTEGPLTAGIPAPRVSAGLPPPPDEGQQGKPLPPPQDDGKKKKKDGGKPLPPPVDEDDRGGKPLPPPSGGGGKPLPPPAEVDLPRPTYPGGPLSRGDHRLRDADRTFDVSGMSYLGFWEGERSYRTQQGRVVTSPQDRGSAYILNLESSLYQEYTLFYYDPSTRGFYWRPGEDHVRTRSRRLVVEFADRETNPLLPWERETFVFSYNHGRSDIGGIRLDSADGAYNYGISYGSSPNDPLTVTAVLTPRQKLRTSPDSNGISATLAPDGATLKLIVEDRWASYYDGENLELVLVIRKDDGSFWRRDPIVFEAKDRAPLQAKVQASAPKFEIPIPVSGSGTFYLESWSFRRAASKISGDGWMRKGAGNKVKK